MTREERETLKKMSLEAYGKSSYWQKFLDRPIVIQQERTLDNGTVEKFTGTLYRTMDQIKEILENALKEKQAKADLAVKKAAEKVLEDHKETFQKLAEAEAKEKQNVE